MRSVSKRKAVGVNTFSYVICAIFAMLSSFVGLMGITLFFSIKYATKIIGPEGFFGIKILPPGPFLNTMLILFVSGILINIVVLLGLRNKNYLFFSILPGVANLLNVLYQFKIISDKGIYWIGKAIFEGQPFSENVFFKYFAFAVIVLCAIGIIVSVVFSFRTEREGTEV